MSDPSSKMRWLHDHETAPSSILSSKSIKNYQRVKAKCMEKPNSFAIFMLPTFNRSLLAAKPPVASTTAAATTLHVARLPLGLASM